VAAAHRAWIFSSAAFDRLQALPAVRPGKNWFDEELFHVGDETATGLTVGWIGRFEPSKDPLAAVAALAELRRSGVTFDAWFAGTGSLEPAMVSLLEREQLSQHVELLGAVSPEVIARRLRTTRALLVTSLWEGQPRAVLEALGSGVGVVAVGVGDIPLLVQHGRTGLIAETTAPGELSALLARVDELASPAEIAASVHRHQARLVIGEMFAALEDESSS
jgi:glycosyltransferase involved in cell wall biosynthesis